MEAELGWTARETFEDALESTVRWYLANEARWRPIREHSYAAERIGMGIRQKA
jgi:dTDP-glucose 4,6-dehydratase